MSILWTFFRGGKDEWMEWVTLRPFYLFSLDSTTSMCMYYKKKLFSCMQFEKWLKIYSPRSLHVNTHYPLTLMKILVYIYFVVLLLKYIHWHILDFSLLDACCIHSSTVNLCLASVQLMFFLKSLSSSLKKKKFYFARFRVL